MRKSIKFAASLAACAMMLAGCSSTKLPEVIETTTISIDDEGGITSYLVEEFNKEYYNVSELTQMAVEDAASYNEEHQEGETIPLTVVDVNEIAGDGGDMVVLQHKYNSAEDYAQYNGSEFFYGTVEEALAEGYDLGALLNSVKDNTPLSQEELMKNPGKTYVLITDAKAVIYCPHKITHVGDGVVYQENGSVDTTKVEGVVVVLMK